eukprot:g8333.t1
MRWKSQGRKGLTVWMTGLSGAGKSTISKHVEQMLFENGILVYRLDGDNLRFGLNSDLGFSPRDRAENVRRVGEVAQILADAGAVRRQHAKGDTPFVEVFVNAPLAEAEKRDPKGLYKKARAGFIHDFTGVSAPYDAPEAPEVELRTDLLSIEERSVPGEELARMFASSCRMGQQIKIAAANLLEYRDRVQSSKSSPSRADHKRQSEAELSRELEALGLHIHTSANKNRWSAAMLTIEDALAVLTAFERSQQTAALEKSLQDSERQTAIAVDLEFEQGIVGLSTTSASRDQGITNKNGFSKAELQKPSLLEVGHRFELKAKNPAHSPDTAGQATNKPVGVLPVKLFRSPLGVELSMPPLNLMPVLPALEFDIKPFQQIKAFDELTARLKTVQRKSAEQALLDFRKKCGELQKTFAVCRLVFLLHFADLLQLPSSVPDSTLHSRRPPETPSRDAPPLIGHIGDRDRGCLPL